MNEKNFQQQYKNFAATPTFTNAIKSLNSALVEGKTLRLCLPQINPLIETTDPLRFFEIQSSCVSQNYYHDIYEVLQNLWALIGWIQPASELSLVNGILVGTGSEKSSNSIFESIQPNPEVMKNLREAVSAQQTLRTVIDSTNNNLTHMKTANLIADARSELVSPELSNTLQELNSYFGAWLADRDSSDDPTLWTHKKRVGIDSISRHLLADFVKALLNNLCKAIICAVQDSSKHDINLADSKKNYSDGLASYSKAIRRWAGVNAFYIQTYLGHSRQPKGDFDFIDWPDTQVQATHNNNLAFVPENGIRLLLVSLKSGQNDPEIKFFQFLGFRSFLDSQFETAQENKDGGEQISIEISSYINKRRKTDHLLLGELFLKLDYAREFHEAWKAIKSCTSWPLLPNGSNVFPFDLIDVAGFDLGVFADLDGTEHPAVHAISLSSYGNIFDEHLLLLSAESLQNAGLSRYSAAIVAIGIMLHVERDIDPSLFDQYESVDFEEWVPLVNQHLGTPSFALLKRPLMYLERASPKYHHFFSGHLTPWIPSPSKLSSVKTTKATQPVVDIKIVSRLKESGLSDQAREYFLSAIDESSPPEFSSLSGYHCICGLESEMRARIRYFSEDAVHELRKMGVKIAWDNRLNRIFTQVTLGTVFGYLLPAAVKLDPEQFPLHRKLTIMFQHDAFDELCNDALELSRERNKLMHGNIGPDGEIQISTRISEKILGTNGILRFLIDTSYRPTATH